MKSVFETDPIAQGDFNSEVQLYKQTHALIDVLEEWRAKFVRSQSVSAFDKFVQ